MIFTLKEGVMLFTLGALMMSVYCFLISLIIYIYFSFKQRKENKEQLNYLNELLFKVTNNTRPDEADAYFIASFIDGCEFERQEHNKVVKDILLALLYQPTYLEKVKKAIINDANKLTRR